MTGADVHITLSNTLMFVSYNASNTQNLQTLTDHTNTPGIANKQLIIFRLLTGKERW